LFNDLRSDRTPRAPLSVGRRPERPPAFAALLADLLRSARRSPDGGKRRRAKAATRGTSPPRRRDRLRGARRARRPRGCLGDDRPGGRRLSVAAVQLGMAGIEIARNREVDERKLAAVPRHATPSPNRRNEAGRGGGRTTIRRARRDSSSNWARSVLLSARNAMCAPRCEGSAPPGR